MRSRNGPRRGPLVVQSKPLAPFKAVVQHRRPVCRQASLQPDPTAGGTADNQQQQQQRLPQELQQPSLSPEQQQQQQRQQQQQQKRAIAAVQPGGQQPAEAEDQLWWVEKFEARRKQLEQQQQQHASSSSSSGSGSESHSNQQPNAAAAAAAAASSPPSQQPPWPRVALQLLQLLVAVSALILWPASLHRAGLYSAKVWLLLLTYLAFFGGGSVWRLVRFGPLASRKQDQQSKTLGTRAAWALFVCMMPVLHWGSIGGYLRHRAAAAAQQGAVDLTFFASLSLYDVIGLVLLAAAVAVNWAAARHLGRAYDRVVAPETLVTTGPYAWVQHPIYSSYMLLFCGFAMFLHSLGYAVLALVVSLGYYGSRAALEADVLHTAFGERYAQYRAKTKQFVPLML